MPTWIVSRRQRVRHPEPGLPPRAIAASSPRSVVATLIRDTGLEAVDAGALRIARYLEPFGLLIGEIAYNRELGPELGYQIVRFTDDSEADSHA